MTGTMVPSDSSCAITGSRLEIASISPRFMMATAPAVAPTPMIAAASGLRPALASRMLTNMLVDEPGAVTPIFMPLRSAGDLYAAALSLLIAEHDAGVLALQHQRLDVLPLRLLRDRVLVRAGDDVDAAADQRLQRARAAREVEDLDVQALGLEVALPLGDGQRQVVEQRLAADADRELGLLRRLRERGGDGEREGNGDAGDGRGRESGQAMHGISSGASGYGCGAYCRAGGRERQTSLRPPPETQRRGRWRAGCRSSRPARGCDATAPATARACPRRASACR